MCLSVFCVCVSWLVRLFVCAELEGKQREHALRVASDADRQRLADELTIATKHHASQDHRAAVVERELRNALLTQKALAAQSLQALETKYENQFADLRTSTDAKVAALEDKLSQREDQLVVMRRQIAAERRTTVTDTEKALRNDIRVLTEQVRTACAVTNCSYLLL